MTLLAIHIPCWLIPLLVGAICAFLGYLLGTSKNNNNDTLNDKITKLEADLAACSKAKSRLQADLDLCTKNAKNLETSLETAKTNIASSLTSNANNNIPFNATDAKAAFGKKIKQDDLKVVEGIGPKIEGLFHNFGIKTWKSLGETSIEKCQEVLKSGGDRYKIHKPGTWPKQAQLAYEGKWKELKDWQDKLDGGK
ncbi:hypothetical protein [Tenacibaculum halocynthiae]|uniref:hypothetical protein n=1 Tax=Tenacibaculum halocynthiae TaxID=1254437 RepID=UPI003D653FA2